MNDSGKRWIAAGAIALALIGAAAATWWMNRSSLPDGFATGNGRIEADEVGIAAKYAGRVASVLVEEGDLVEPGQVLAHMDSAEIEAELREARARTREAVEQRDVARANIAQREAECDLADRELRRSSLLFEKDVEPESELDVKRSRFMTAKAACDAANAQLSDAEAAIEAARARVARIEAQRAETVLRAPARGRVLYRLAEPGEVLSAGGRVLTLVDLTDVYMEIFLPSRQATRVAIGAEARVVLDALPDAVIPASVSFVAPEAQFTPKQVETPSERDKLMFRVKVRIPREVVEPRIELVKTGVRGVAYVRLDGADGAAWPEPLEARLPPDGRGPS
ncbi:MAG: HlyD family secretion protein [Myxococcota bacterium]